MTTLLQIQCRVGRYFENLTIFSEVTGKNVVSFFVMRHSVYIGMSENVHARFGGHLDCVKY